MLRYSLLRALIFFGCVAALWLIGLRSREEVIPLVLGAALLSAVISFFALKPFREEYSRTIAEKMQARAQAKPQPRSGDEAAEDAEDESPEYR